MRLKLNQVVEEVVRNLSDKEDLEKMVAARGVITGFLDATDKDINNIINALGWQVLGLQQQLKLIIEG
jgi:hypothetical protein